MARTITFFLVTFIVSKKIKLERPFVFYHSIVITSYSLVILRIVYVKIWVAGKAAG